MNVIADYAFGIRPARSVDTISTPRHSDIIDFFGYRDVLVKTALDFDRSTLDAHEQKFIDHVRQDGWCGTLVHADAEGPGFFYTTGFWYKFGLPEVIVFSLPKDAAHDICWSIYRALESGSRLPIGAPVDELIERYSVIFLPVAKSKFAELLGWSRWFYHGDGFECVQMVWPDKRGRFPWADGCSENFIELQPDLTDGAWARAGRN